MVKPPRINILVIDDDPKVRDLISTFFLLRRDEVSCVMASDTQQAYLKMSNQEFDIFLVDKVMPGRNGIDFALSIRKMLKYSRIPIILMSGAIGQDDVIRAMEGGIKDILVKPFTLRQLNDKIIACLGKNR